MRTLVIGHGPDADSLRTIALRNGLECRCISPSEAESPDFAGYGAADIVLLHVAKDWDTSIRILRDLRCGRESVSVVAVGPTHEPKRILQLLREGLTEYLDASDVDNELDAALARLKRGRDNVSRSATVVGVLSASGGSGTSVIAANLATLYAMQGEETLLMDLCTSGGDQTALFDVRPQHSLTDVCQHVDRLDHLMLRHSAIRHNSGLNILASPPAGSDSTAVTARTIRKVISTAGAAYSNIIVDLDRGISPSQVAAIGAADVLLLIVRLDVLSLRNTAHLLTRLDQLGVDGQKVRVVINRYGQRGDVGLKSGNQLLGVEFLGRIPNDPRRVGTSINRGIPLVLQHRRTGVAKALVNLARRIDGLTHKHPGHEELTPVDLNGDGTTNQPVQEAPNRRDEAAELPAGLLRVNGHYGRGNQNELDHTPGTVSR